MDASSILKVALAAVCSFALSCAFAADTVADASPAWSSPRIPFEPRLIKGDADEEPTCTAMLGAARKAYLDTSSLIDLYNALPGKASPIGWQDLAVPFEQPPRDALQFATLALAQGKASQVLVKRANTWSWRGPTFSAFLFADQATLDVALSASKNVEELLSKGRRFYPSPSDPSTMDGEQSWAWNELFALGDGYYFLDQGNDFALANAEAVRVYRLAAGGNTRMVCNFALSDPAAITAFESRPAFKAFIRVLRGIGYGGPDCGTLHSSTMHGNSAQAAVTRAALRPWAISAARKGSGYYRYFGGIETFLFQWSLGDPWSRREFLTLDEHRRAAERDVAAYLVASYGLAPEQAGIQARRMVDDIVAAHLLIPNSYVPGAANWFGDNPPVIDLKLVNPNERPDSIAPAMTPLQVSMDGAEALAPRLFRALGDSTARKAYLAAADDRELANAYGKTVLMTAAHLNALDAVKELLAAGAGVNAITHEPSLSGCESELKHHERTALMYAAENASFEVMDALVAAGASPDAKDSEGVSVDDYLARNPRLASLGTPPPTNVAEALTRFHLQPANNEPSYSCAGKLSALETLICGDPSAALYDREMARGFAAWKEKSSNASDAVAEQLDWLRRRNRVCGAMDGDDAKRLCLEEMLRARSRYIENRLAE